MLKFFKICINFQKLQANYAHNFGKAKFEISKSPQNSDADQADSPDHKSLFSTGTPTLSKVWKFDSGHFWVSTFSPQCQVNWIFNPNCEPILALL